MYLNQYLAKMSSNPVNYISHPLGIIKTIVYYLVGLPFTGQFDQCTFYLNDNINL